MVSNDETCYQTFMKRLSISQFLSYKQSVLAVIWVDDNIELHSQYFKVNFQHYLKCNKRIILCGMKPSCKIIV